MEPPLILRLHLHLKFIVSLLPGISVTRRFFGWILYVLLSVL